MLYVVGPLDNKLLDFLTSQLSIQALIVDHALFLVGREKMEGAIENVWPTILKIRWKSLEDENSFYGSNG